MLDFLRRHNRLRYVTNYLHGAYVELSDTFSSLTPPLPTQEQERHTGWFYKGCWTVKDHYYISQINSGVDHLYQI
jgi:hypothetical protein